MKVSRCSVSFVSDDSTNLSHGFQVSVMQLTNQPVSDKNIVYECRPPAHREKYDDGNQHFDDLLNAETFFVFSSTTNKTSMNLQTSIYKKWVHLFSGVCVIFHWLIATSVWSRKVWGRHECTGCVIFHGHHTAWPSLSERKWSHLCTKASESAGRPLG